MNPKPRTPRHSLARLTRLVTRIALALLVLCGGGASAEDLPGAWTPIASEPGAAPAKPAPSAAPTNAAPVAPAAPRARARRASAQAAKAATATPPSASAPTPSSSVNPCSQEIWDRWYTIRDGGGVQVAALHETFCSSSGNRFFYKSWMKRREQGLNLVEENLGAFAKNDNDLSPIAFNYIWNAQGIQLTADGGIKDGKTFVGKVRRGDTGHEVTRALDSRVLFSVFFPLWLGKRLSQLKPANPVSFRAFREDEVWSQNRAEWFKVLPGQVTLLEPDSRARETKTTRVEVKWEDLESIWYVERTGAAMRVEFPGLGRVMQQSTQAEAESGLTTGPSDS